MKKELIKNKLPLLLIFLGILLTIGGTTTAFLSSNESSSKSDVVDKNDEQEDSDTPKPNVNENNIGDKELGELKFTNSSLIVTESGSTLTTVVQNTSDEDVEVGMLIITVKDEEGNTIATLDGYVGDVIPANESREIISSVDINLENANDIEYQLNN